MFSFLNDSVKVKSKVAIKCLIIVSDCLKYDLKQVNKERLLELLYASKKYDGS